MNRYLGALLIVLCMPVFMLAGALVAGLATLKCVHDFLEG